MSYKELNRLRAILNHDKVKNEFLNKIGTIRHDLNIYERSDLILKVWIEHCGEGLMIEDLPAIRDTVRQGLENWPSVFNELKDFFEYTPQKCGYRGTKKFEDVKQVFFDGPRSVTAVISQFVNQFEEIGKLQENERNMWLKVFWDAADAIHKTLSEMRTGMEDDALFGDYFEKL